MKTIFGEVNGTEWDELCKKLLTVLYREQNFTPVPSKFGGDFGIEGFTNTGILFQCYCPEESEIDSSLYEHQRNKITTDIGKLIKNIVEIQKLMGTGNLIMQWHFLTPYFDNKALIAHIRIQEERVKKELGAQVSNKFEICIKDDHSFISVASFFINSGSIKASLTSEPTTDVALEDLITEHDDLFSRIKDKIKKIKSVSNDEQRIKMMTRSIFESYERGQRELDELRCNFPQLYSKVISLKEITESLVERESLLSDISGGTFLRKVRDDYKTSIEKELGVTVEQSLITCLADEAISDWIVRCPMDF